MGDGVSGPVDGRRCGSIVCLTCVNATGVGRAFLWIQDSYEDGIRNHGTASVANGMHMHNPGTRRMSPRLSVGGGLEICLIAKPNWIRFGEVMTWCNRPPVDFGQ